MRRLFWLTCFCNLIYTPALAQSPIPSPAQLCAKVSDTESVSCEEHFINILISLGPHLWGPFAVCTVNKDNNEPTKLDHTDCLTADALQHFINVKMALAEGKSPPQASIVAATNPAITAPAANGLAYTPEELCQKNSDTECILFFNKFQSMLGSHLWTQFSSCAATKPFDKLVIFSGCLTGEMQRTLETQIQKPSKIQAYPPPN